MKTKSSIVGSPPNPAINVTNNPTSIRKIVWFILKIPDNAARTMKASPRK